MGVHAAPLPLDVPDELPDAPDDPLPVPPSSLPPELDAPPESSLPVP
jgi:hypothetical protein